MRNVEMPQRAPLAQKSGACATCGSRKAKCRLPVRWLTRIEIFNATRGHCGPSNLRAARKLPVAGAPHVCCEIFPSFPQSAQIHLCNGPDSSPIGTLDLQNSRLPPHAPVGCGLQRQRRDSHSPPDNSATSRLPRPPSASRSRAPCMRPDNSLERLCGKAEICCGLDRYGYWAMSATGGMFAMSTIAQASRGCLYHVRGGEDAC